jgi:hypothetical protein
MPLAAGKSRAVIGKNVAELMSSYHRKGAIGTSRPKSAKKARTQAIAIALRKSREY